MANRKIEAMYVVVRQHERMNRGDGILAPTGAEHINYYVGMQRYWEEPAEPTGTILEAGQCILLAHCGCGTKALTFVNGLVQDANDGKLSPGQVQEKCWAYIEQLHAASKPVKKAKRLSEELSEEPVAAAEPASHQRDAGPTTIHEDINDAMQGG